MLTSLLVKPEKVQNQKKHMEGIDLVKTIAVLFVLIVHALLGLGFYERSIQSVTMVGFSFIRWIAFSCVPLFLITTGYLQSRKELNKKYYTSILKWVMSYVIIAILCALTKMYILHEDNSLWKAFLSIFSFEANSYSWYFAMYIGLFLLIPFLNILWKNLNKKQRQILIGSLIFLTALPNFFKTIVIADARLAIVTDEWIAIYPLTYYFIGAYIKEYPIRIKKGVGVLALSILAMLETTLTYVFNTKEIFAWNIFAGYGNLFTLLIATTIFLTTYWIQIDSSKIRKVLKNISMITFEMFLISNIFDIVIYENLPQKGLSYIIFMLPCAILFAWVGGNIIHFISTRLTKKMQENMQEKRQVEEKVLISK